MCSDTNYDIVFCRCVPNTVKVGGKNVVLFGATISVLKKSISNLWLLIDHHSKVICVCVICVICICKLWVKRHSHPLNIILFNLHVFMYVIGRSYMDYTIILGFISVSTLIRELIVVVPGRTMYFLYIAESISFPIDIKSRTILSRLPRVYSNSF